MEPTTAPPYQLPPIEDAKRQYVELFGSALVMNTYLKIALLCVSVIAVGLLVLNFRAQSKYANVKPLVIRIDEVGRGVRVEGDATTCPGSHGAGHFGIVLVVRVPGGEAQAGRAIEVEPRMSRWM